MKKLIIIIAAILPMFVFGQQKNNAVTLSCGGVGNNLSINYERVLARSKDGFVFSMGAGYRAEKYSEYTNYVDNSGILLGLLIIPFNPSLGTDIAFGSNKTPEILSVTKQYDVKSAMISGAIRYKMIEFGLTSRTDFYSINTSTTKRGKTNPQTGLLSENIYENTFGSFKKSYILPSIAIRYEKGNFLGKIGFAKAAPETSSSKRTFLPFATIGIAF